MVTFVGKQESFADAVKELVELEYDAIEAYEASIERLSNSGYQKKLTEFKEDHLHHIKKLTQVLQQHKETAPEGPDSTKQWLAKGKVVLSNLIGDIAILRAMKSNEIDTNSAYEHMCMHESIWEDCVKLMHDFLDDEKKHKLWLETTIEKA